MLFVDQLGRGVNQLRSQGLGKDGANDVATIWGQGGRESADI
jgi:hypothetical protein